MRRALIYVLLSTACAAYTDEDEFEVGDEVPLKFMRSTTRATAETRSSTQTQTKLRFFLINGTEVPWDGSSVEYPFDKVSWPGLGPLMDRGPNIGQRRHFSQLNLESSPGKLLDNNLGGLGPNTFELNCVAMTSVTTDRLGNDISMRIDNTSEYRPWDVAQNGFNGCAAPFRR